MIWVKKQRATYLGHIYLFIHGQEVEIWAQEMLIILMEADLMRCLNYDGSLNFKTN